jgi:hypothetical protein
MRDNNLALRRSTPLPPVLLHAESHDDAVRDDQPRFRNDSGPRVLGQPGFQLTK